MRNAIVRIALQDVPVQRQIRNQRLSRACSSSSMRILRSSVMPSWPYFFFHT
jgi:hypothetical protein